MNPRILCVVLLLTGCSELDTDAASLAINGASLGDDATIVSVRPLTDDEDEVIETPNCTFPNGVVRSWHLFEKNRYDFRWSKHYCRNMEEDGTLGPVYDFVEHFFNSGNGNYGITQIPLTALPVGVRLRLKGDDHKTAVADVSLLHANADDIFIGSLAYVQAPFALGRNVGRTETLACPRGEVVRNLTVWKVRPSGGPNQSRISNVAIHCSPLVSR